MTIQNDSINPINLKLQPTYYRNGITSTIIIILATIYVIANFDLSLLLILTVVISAFPMNIIILMSTLNITEDGLHIRRGWQRAFIPWDAIELLGFAKYNRFYLIPYIVLHHPVNGFNAVKLIDIAPEFQHRTITLEGWEQQQKIAETIAQRISRADNPWYVMPVMKRYVKSFIFYNKINQYISIANLIIIWLIYLMI